MTRLKTFHQPLRPSRVAQDLVGLTKALEELVFNSADSSSAVAATASVAQVYASELALFFTDQHSTQEHILEALEVQWLERRSAEGTKD